jgi:hypothetical protein
MAFDLAPYSGAISSTADFLSGLMKRVFPEKMSELDAAKMQQELTMALVRGEFEPVMAQLKVNEAEARHESVFVAGWRPFVGWVCGAAFAYAFVLQPMLLFGFTVAKWEAPPLPALDMGPLMAVLGGILGIGGMRSYEKVKGATEVKVGK